MKVSSKYLISIHSLRMEGDKTVIITIITYKISIHSLRMEGDSMHRHYKCHFILFQSTPSAWRETRHSLKLDREEIFQSTPSAWRETAGETSIHTNHCYFNPLPPHGGRQNRNVFQNQKKNFNPLPPHGGRPSCTFLYPPPPDISIHSLRMEGDRSEACRRASHGYFNPLPPHGGRPCYKRIFYG